MKLWCRILKRACTYLFAGTLCFISLYGIDRILANLLIGLDLQVNVKVNIQSVLYFLQNILEEEDSKLKHILINKVSIIIKIITGDKTPLFFNSFSTSSSLLKIAFWLATHDSRRVSIIKILWFVTRTFVSMLDTFFKICFKKGRQNSFRNSLNVWFVSLNLQIQGLM